MTTPSMWIDLTHPVREDMPVWPDSDRPRISQQCEIDETCPVRVSWLSLGAHTGTHLDAPSHFLRDGAMVESLSLDDLIGPGWIADAGDARILDDRTLESLAIPKSAVRLLVKTSNTSRALMSKTEFDTSYVGLDLSGARWLLARGIRLIGLDYLSVQAFEASDDTHRELLAAKTVLIEGVDLSRTTAGWHELVCLPFLAKDLDGAPVRVVARRIESLRSNEPPRR